MARDETYTLFDKIKTVTAFALFSGVCFWFAWAALFDPAFAEEVAGATLRGRARTQGIGAAVQGVVGVLGTHGTAGLALLLGLGSSAFTVKFARTPVEA